MTVEAEKKPINTNLIIVVILLIIVVILSIVTFKQHSTVVKTKSSCKKHKKEVVNLRNLNTELFEANKALIDQKTQKDIG